MPKNQEMSPGPGTLETNILGPFYAYQMLTKQYLGASDCFRNVLQILLVRFKGTVENPWENLKFPTLPFEIALPTDVTLELMAA